MLPRTEFWADAVLKTVILDEKRLGDPIAGNPEIVYIDYAAARKIRTLRQHLCFDAGDDVVVIDTLEQVIESFRRIQAKNSSFKIFQKAFDVFVGAVVVFELHNSCDCRP